MTANPQELRRRGYKALVDALGFVDAIRFIQQVSEGRGDYTRDRKTWLDIAKDAPSRQVFIRVLHRVACARIRQKKE